MCGWVEWGVYVCAIEAKAVLIMIDNSWSTPHNCRHICELNCFIFCLCTNFLIVVTCLVLFLNCSWSYTHLNGMMGVWAITMSACILHISVITGSWITVCFYSIKEVYKHFIGTTADFSGCFGICLEKKITCRHIKRKQIRICLFNVQSVGTPTRSQDPQTVCCPHIMQVLYDMKHSFVLDTQTQLLQLMKKMPLPLQKLHPQSKGILGGRYEVVAYWPNLKNSLWGFCR